jgi:hypothetical protein
MGEILIQKVAGDCCLDIVRVSAWACQVIRNHGFAAEQCLLAST